MDEKASSGFFVALQAGVMTGVVIAVCYLVLYFSKTEITQFIELGMNFTAIFSCVFLTLMMFRKLDGSLTFRKALFGGWLSVLILGLFMIIFRKILYTFLFKDMTIQQGYYGQLLLLYSALGMTGSAILGFILKKSA